MNNRFSFVRYLLNFGEISYYLGYNAMKNFFPTYRLNPNKECTNLWCQRRQIEAIEKQKRMKGEREQTQNEMK
jgi:ubiquitin-like modifier-activating enzyme 5